MGTRLFTAQFTAELIGQTAVRVVMNREDEGMIEAPAARTGALPATHSPAGVQRDAMHIPDMAVPVMQDAAPKHPMPISVKHPAVHARAPRAPTLRKLKHQLNGSMGIEQPIHTGASKHPKK